MRPRCGSSGMRKLGCRQPRPKSTGRRFETPPSLSCRLVFHCLPSLRNCLFTLRFRCLRGLKTLPLCLVFPPAYAAQTLALAICPAEPAGGAVHTGDRRPCRGGGGVSGGAPAAGNPVGRHSPVPFPLSAAHCLFNAFQHLFNTCSQVRRSHGGTRGCDRSDNTCHQLPRCLSLCCSTALSVKSVHRSRQHCRRWRRGWLGGQRLGRRRRQRKLSMGLSRGLPRIFSLCFLVFSPALPSTHRSCLFFCLLSWLPS